MSFNYLSGKRTTALIVAAVILAIAGCATTDQDATPKVPPNPEISQATLDLEQAREMGAVWVVRDPAFDNRLVSLDDMLRRAVSLNDRQQSEAASALARRVSRFARLGIQQATAEVGAGPYYPQ